MKNSQKLKNISNQKNNDFTQAFLNLAEKENYTKREAEWKLNDMKQNIDTFLLLILIILGIMFSGTLIVSLISLLSIGILLYINNRFFKKVRFQMLQALHWMDEKGNDTKSFIEALEELLNEVEELND